MEPGSKHHQRSSQPKGQVLGSDKPPMAPNQTPPQEPSVARTATSEILGGSRQTSRFTRLNTLRRSTWVAGGKEPEAVGKGAYDRTAAYPSPADNTPKAALFTLPPTVSQTNIGEHAVCSVEDDYQTVEEATAAADKLDQEIQAEKDSSKKLSLARKACQIRMKACMLQRQNRPHLPTTTVTDSTTSGRDCSPPIDNNDAPTSLQKAKPASAIFSNPVQPTPSGDATTRSATFRKLRNQREDASSPHLDFFTSPSETDCIEQSDEEESEAGYGVGRYSWEDGYGTSPVHTHNSSKALTAAIATSAKSTTVPTAGKEQVTAHLSASSHESAPPCNPQQQRSDASNARQPKANATICEQAGNHNIMITDLVATHGKERNDAHDRIDQLTKDNERLRAENAELQKAKRRLEDVIDEMLLYRKHCRQENKTMMEH
ncbi:predicted protein [Aspergillus terreus NIH2624]|uniref:Uncharacterized protein n=1 Tax=Aspergillus terreus (strain NIH 2624 / FGSC A1156) TaxID=341663 RepID=Q0CG44_ASPTN|nr:uncharacterized protein ATEG_07348 [Aspergillus terreus NIH2624]EAU32732.1 predicted protein [Aspergillus terreus NIH2624]